MFKSIEYKLFVFVSLLVVSVAATTWFATQQLYVYAALSAIVIIIALSSIRRNYRQFNKNIVFLLNALDNGDYSFNFTENKLSRREKELNAMLNRIKEILSKAKNEIIENELFLGLVTESVSTGIIILDENNSIIKTNRAATQLIGLPVFTHLNQLARIEQSLPDVFRNLEPSHTKTIKIANERQETHITLRASSIDSKHIHIKIIALNSIGSELEYKEMDSWIRLIRVMTHEIMNSIAPITSLTDTLLSAFGQENRHKQPDDELVQNTIEALQTINSTARGLIGFVNSYRQFTGIPQPKLKSTDLTDVVHQAIALVSATAKQKGIEIDHTPPEQQILVSIDTQQIMQVLVNLLKNAIDAIVVQQGGCIRVSITRKDNKLYVDVCDNGVPISADVLPNIFVPFFTTKNEGSGIGLSISRYIMRLHGGTLNHFTEREWTVFRMTF